MRYLIFPINDETSEEIVQSYAEFLLEQAGNDEMYTGIPSPFGDTFFIGDIKEFSRGQGEVE